MEEVINYGWLSLIPAVVAVVLAFATRNVVLSLAISLFLGIMIQVGANPWLSLQHLFSDYLFVDLATDNNPQTIVMMATVGGFVALIEKSGGARAFAKAVANSVNSKVKAQLAAWLGWSSSFPTLATASFWGPCSAPSLTVSRHPGQSCPIFWTPPPHQSVF